MAKDWTLPLSDQDFEGLLPYLRTHSVDINPLEDNAGYTISHVINRAKEEGAIVLNS